MKDLPPQPSIILLCEDSQRILDKFYSKDNVDQICLTTESTLYKIEDFEEIWSMINIKPWKAEFRNIFICDSHKLSPTISNKLLKILEDTTYNRFVFLTQSTNSLLSTIRSRSFIINFNEKGAAPPSYGKGDFLQDLKLENVSSITGLWQMVKKSENILACDLMFEYEKQSHHPGISKKLMNRTLLSRLSKVLNFF